MDFTIASNTTAVGAGDAAPASGTVGEFTNGNPATSTPATQLPAYQMNAIVQEIVNLIEGGGLTPDKANNAQAVAAVKALVFAQFAAPASLIMPSTAIGAGYSNTGTVNLTAPHAGVILAFGKINLAAPASASISGNLKVAGTSVSSDSTELSQFHFGVAVVPAGPVAVDFTISSGGSSPAVNATGAVGAIFIPTA